MDTREKRARIGPGIFAAFVVVGASALLGLAQFIAHARTDEMDGWLFAYYGRQLLAGSNLYTDLWDIKPPGIFWVNAAGLALGGGSLAGVWALCGVAAGGAVAVFYVVTRRLYGAGIAAAATLMAALYLTLHDFHVGSNRPATFFVLAELIAFALWFRNRKKDRGRSGRGAFLAGVAAGVGFCFKQTTLALALAVAAHTLHQSVRGRTTWRWASSRLGLFASGWCLAVALAVLALLVTSDLSWAWHAVFGFNFRGLGHGAGSLWPSSAWAVSYLRPLALPLILAGATLARAAWCGWAKPEPRIASNHHHPKVDDTRTQIRAPGASLGTKPPVAPTSPTPHNAHARREQAAENEPDGLLSFLWMWFALAFYLALIGPRHRPWYLAHVLPPLLLLVAHSLHLLFGSRRNNDRRPPAHYVFVAALWFAYMMLGPVTAQVEMAMRQYHHAFVAPPDTHAEALASAICRHAAPRETVFCFGYRPDLLWRVDRPPAIRYAGTVSAGGWGDPHNPLMTRIVELLKQDSPKVIVYRVGTEAHPEVRAFVAWLLENYGQPDASALPELWIRSGRVRRAGLGVENS